MNKNQLIFAIILMCYLGSLFGSIAIAQTNEPKTFIFIESRFRLWDTTEKMIDSNFTITIINTNSTMNNEYKLSINDNISYGNFSGYIQIPISVSVPTVNIMIDVNNKTEFVQLGIKVITGITPTGISQISEPWYIQISPLEWGKKQWNIFYSLILSAFICIYISYNIVIHYRKLQGVREIK